MPKTKRKGPSPVEQRLRDFGAIGMAPDAGLLLRNADVEVTRAAEQRDGKIVQNDSARRADAFDALRQSMKRDPFVGCYDAARRFERDLLVSLGQHDHGRPPERVDCERGAFNRVDVMLMAVERLDSLRQRIGEREWWLLNELIYPTRNYDGWRPLRINSRGEEEYGAEQDGWRAVVGYITGETHDHAQGAAVRAACVSLRDAYNGTRARKAA